MFECAQKLFDIYA